MTRYGRLLAAVFIGLMILWPLNWLLVNPVVWILGVLGFAVRWTAPVQLATLIGVPAVIAVVIGARWAGQERSIERFGLFGVTLWLLLVVVAMFVWPTVERLLVVDAGGTVAGLPPRLWYQYALIVLVYPVAYLLVYRRGYARIRAAAGRLRG